MKRFPWAIVLVLSIAVSFFACSPSSNSPDAPLSAPKNIRQAEKLELGEVTILTYGYWSTFITDDKRAQQILQLVDAHILRERNISMTLQIKRKEIPYQAVAAGVAAGDPPEIVVRTYNDNPDKRGPSPLRLNESIDAFGPDLMTAIPANGWDRCRIGNAIVAIPSVGLLLSPNLCVNSAILARNGWAMPQTADDLVALLSQAKAIGVRPLDGDMWNAFTPCFGLDVDAWGYQDDDGKVLPLRDCPEYDAWLEKMHAWKQAGYFQEAVGSDGNTINDGNFLITSLDWWQLARSNNLVPLPLLAMGKAQPLAVQPSIVEQYTFESYDKPEALVTLLDWTYGSAENHDLIARGELSTDYQLLGTGGYELIKDGETDSMVQIRGQTNQWELQEYLSMDAFRGNRIRGCAVDKNLRQAMTYQDIAVRPSKFVKLPTVTQRYALPGTKLYDAWHPELTMDSPEMDYINGVITRAEYDRRKSELAEQTAPQRELLMAWLHKSYDPLKVMYVPTTGTSAVVPVADASTTATQGK